jgi:hypothetical protein
VTAVDVHHRPAALMIAQFSRKGGNQYWTTRPIVKTNESIAIRQELALSPHAALDNKIKVWCLCLPIGKLINPCYTPPS